MLKINTYYYYYFYYYLSILKMNHANTWLDQLF